MAGSFSNGCHWVVSRLSPILVVIPLQRRPLAARFNPITYIFPYGSGARPPPVLAIKCCAAETAALIANWLLGHGLALMVRRLSCTGQYDSASPTTRLM
jgi:hypothetical protein